MLFKSEKTRPILGLACALGWSLAYPFIKLGYGELQIASTDLGSKILFAGIRFFMAGLLVLAFSAVQRRKLTVTGKEMPALALFALVNTALHYLFSYIGLSYIPSSRSTILDSMNVFFLIILSGLFLADDTFNGKKILGCLLGFCGILTISITPGGGLFSNITFLGDGMILLNACCAAGGGLLTRFISKKMDMMAATGYGMSGGGLMLLAVGLAVGVRQPWNVTPWGVTILFVLILISAVGQPSHQQGGNLQFPHSCVWCHVFVPAAEGALCLAVYPCRLPDGSGYLYGQSEIDGRTKGDGTGTCGKEPKLSGVSERPEGDKRRIACPGGLCPTLPLHGEYSAPQVLSCLGDGGGGRDPEPEPLGQGAAGDAPSPPGNGTRRIHRDLPGYPD